MNLLYYWSKFLKKARGSAVTRSLIDRSSKIEPGSLVVNSTMDRHSFCGYDCELNHCDVGRFCSIANGVIVGGSRHPLEWVGMSPVFYAGRDSVKAKFSTYEPSPIKRTTILNDVWIGRNALIAQGVRIGNGAVIGMGSVVTRDVDDYAIVGGSPARLIRYRFDEAIIQRLLEISWWEFSDEQLQRYAVYFRDPVEFLKQFDSA